MRKVKVISVESTIKKGNAMSYDSTYESGGETRTRSEVFDLDAFNAGDETKLFAGESASIDINGVPTSAVVKRSFIRAICEVELDEDGNEYIVDIIKVLS